MCRRFSSSCPILLPSLSPFTSRRRQTPKKLPLPPLLAQHSLERCAQKATTLGRRRLGGRRRRRRRRRGCRPPPPPYVRPRRPTPEVKQDGRFCSRQAVKGLFHLQKKNGQKSVVGGRTPPKMEEWRGGGSGKLEKKVLMRE